MPSLFLACTLLLLSFTHAHAQDDWALQKDADDIQLYTRFRSDSAINEFKAVMRLKGDIDSAFAVLSDMGRVTSTDPHTKEGRILKSISENEYYFYQLLEMPFFMGDRDLISHVTIAKTETGYFLYGISEPDYLPQMADVTRIENARLVISVRKITRSTFELTLKGTAELPIDANIPKLVMNKAVVGTMHGRMKRMQQLLGLPVSHERE